MGKRRLFALVFCFNCLALLGIYLAVWNDEMTWFRDGGKSQRQRISERILKLDSKPRGVTDDKFFPDSKAPGDHFIDYDARTLYLLVHDDDSGEVTRDVVWEWPLYLSLVLTTNETRFIPDTSAIVELISRSLNISEHCVIFKEIFVITSQGDFSSVKMEIRLTKNKCDIEFSSISNILRRLFYIGDFSRSLNATVFAMELTKPKSSGQDVESRIKRQTLNEESVEYVKPYKLIVCCFLEELAIEQPFSLNVTILDFRENKVTATPYDEQWTVSARLSHWEPNSLGESSLAGQKEVEIHLGTAHFQHLRFTDTGQNFKMEFTLLNGGHPIDLVHGFTTPWITVTERPLELSLASSGLPYSAVEGEFLQPFPVVQLLDKLTQTDVKPRDLRNFKWKGEISLKYDVYDSVLEGPKTVENVGGRVPFPSLIIKKWGLWYYLRVRVFSDPPSDRNYTLDIGPFDVRPAVNNDQPIVTYTSTMCVQFLIDGDFRDIRRDQLKFRVFFINFFSKKYRKVIWLNVTAIPGSIVATSEIMGSLKQLNDTASELARDINKDLTLTYLPGKPWRVKRAAEGGKDETKEKKEGQGNLPLAWIAAIVINGVLVFLFILFVVYCYCRSKKRSHQPEQEDPYGRHYESSNERSYNEKAASNPHQRGRMPGTERAALISTGAQRGAEPRSVFTIEDERRRLRDEEDLEDYEPDGYSTPVNEHRDSNGRPHSRPISSPPYYYDDERDRLPATVETKGTVTDELDDDLEDEYKERLRNYGSYEDELDDPRSPGANLRPSGPASPIHGFKSPSPTMVIRQTSPPPPPPPPPPISPVKTPEAIIERSKTPETRSETRNLSREGFYYRDPMDMPAVNAIVPVPVPMPVTNQEAWQNPQKTDANVAPEEKPPQMFDVYLLKEGSGIKSKKGQISLNLEAPMTLTHLRSTLNSSSNPKIKSFTKKKYIFMTDDLRSVDLPEGALLVKNLYPSNAIYVQQIDDEWQAPKKKERPADPIEPRPVPKTYAVNLYRSDRGVKEFVGEISLPDGGPLTLTHLRSTLCKAPLSVEGMAWRDYVFLSENLEDVSAPEGALLVDLLYPNQEIIFRLIEDETDKKANSKKTKTQAAIPGPPKAPSETKRKDFVYIGPMGMCTAAECEKPAKIKCLDCGQVGYCTTRHMRDDQFTHKRVCFKPQWKH